MSLVMFQPDCSIAWMMSERSRSSKLTARKPGRFTSGERDAVRFVGPMEPATKRGRVASLAVAASAARRATSAAALFRG